MTIRHTGVPHDGVPRTGVPNDRAPRKWVLRGALGIAVAVAVGLPVARADQDTPPAPSTSIPTPTVRRSPARPVPRAPRIRPVNTRSKVHVLPKAADDQRLQLARRLAGNDSGST